MRMTTEIVMKSVYCKRVHCGGTAPLQTGGKCSNDLPQGAYTLRALSISSLLIFGVTRVALQRFHKLPRLHSALR